MLRVGHVARGRAPGLALGPVVVLACVPALCVRWVSIAFVGAGQPRFDANARSIGAPRRQVRLVPANAGATWGSPTWNWGYAVGDAHDAAAVLRQRLQSQPLRAAWLQQMVVAPAEVPWEDVKLALALLWQRASRERRDGGPGGWSDVMWNLVDAKYEGGLEQDRKFVVDMEARLPQALLVEEGPEDDVDAWRRRVATSALQALSFVELGL